MTWIWSKPFAGKKKIAAVVFGEKNYLKKGVTRGRTPLTEICKAVLQFDQVLLKCSFGAVNVYVSLKKLKSGGREH